MNPPLPPGPTAGTAPPVPQSRRGPSPPPGSRGGTGITRGKSVENTGFFVLPRFFPRSTDRYKREKSPLHNIECPRFGGEHYLVEGIQIRLFFPVFSCCTASEYIDIFMQYGLLYLDFYVNIMKKSYNSILTYANNRIRIYIIRK